MKQRVNPLNQPGWPQQGNLGADLSFNQEFVESEENDENNFFSFQDEDQSSGKNDNQAKNNRINFLFLINQDATLVVKPFRIY